MNCTAITPFDRIDAAQEYLALLSETVADNRRRIEADITEAPDQRSPRLLEVLKLVAYNLESLEKHLKASRQALNNLCKLRRLLSSECVANVTTKQKTGEVSDMAKTA